jgi:hypothetical protein
MRGMSRARIAAVAVAAALAALAPSAASADRGPGGDGGSGVDGGGDDSSGKDECRGGGFSLVLPGSTVTARPGQDLRTTVAADRLGAQFLVRGTYVEFTVDAATLGISNWTLTGAPNPADITAGRRTVVFASKTPDLRGATLTSGMDIRLRDGDLRLQRSGAAVSMKIQAKDCAQGGIFQMEPERSHGTATVFTHRLAPEVFYFDNPNFRARIGTTVPFETDDGQTIQLAVTARVNFGNDVSPRFVGRDSAQVATRIPEPVCANAFGTHCGGVSRWSVASGGRMGQVMGEDAVEVSPAATDCVEDCQAQNQIRGRAVVLGFPFPVPESSRLTPRGG